MPGGRCGDTTGQGAHGDRDHQPGPPTPTRLANPARNRDPPGPGHRPQFGQRHLLAGQLGWAWRGQRGRQQRGHLGVSRWGLVRGKLTIQQPLGGVPVEGQRIRIWGGEQTLELGRPR